MIDLIVVGGSAGGIEALLSLVNRLPAAMPTSMLIVLHVPAQFPSHLPNVLSRRTTLDVRHASDGEAIVEGTIRIAPPDRHLIVVDRRLALTSTPKENRHRPAIDALFRSAAESFGPSVAAVLLSGAPGDGVEGVLAVQRSGGRVFVQDPRDAIFSALPQSAIDVVKQAEVGIAAEIGDRLAWLIGGSTDAIAEPLHEAREGIGTYERPPAQAWRPSAFGCPDCTGVLWQLDDGERIRFRCRIGHSYGPDALMDGKGDELESALWSAINAMEERAQLAQRLAHRARAKELEDVARRYSGTARDMQAQVKQIRELLASWSDPRLEGSRGPAEQPGLDVADEAAVGEPSSRS